MHIGAFDTSVIVPALASAATVVTAVPDPVLSSDDGAIRLIVIGLGVLLGTIARSPAWFDRITGQFKRAEFLKDVASMGLIGMCAWAVAVTWELSNAMIGASTGVVTWIGLGPFRDILIDAIKNYLTKKGPQP